MPADGEATRTDERALIGRASVLTVGAMLRNQARDRPERIAVDDGSRQLSFAVFNEKQPSAAGRPKSPTMESDTFASGVVPTFSPSHCFMEFMLSPPGRALLSLRLFVRGPQQSSNLRIW